MHGIPLWLVMEQLRSEPSVVDIDRAKPITLLERIASATRIAGFYIKSTSIFDEIEPFYMRDRNTNVKSVSAACEYKTRNSQLDYVVTLGVTLDQDTLKMA